MNVNCMKFNLKGWILLTASKRQVLFRGPFNNELPPFFMESGKRTLNYYCFTNFNVVALPTLSVKFTK